MYPNAGAGPELAPVLLVADGVPALGLVAIEGPELAGVHLDAGAATELAPRTVYGSRPSRACGL